MFSLVEVNDAASGAVTRVVTVIPFEFWESERRDAADVDTSVVLMMYTRLRASAVGLVGQVSEAHTLAIATASRMPSFCTFVKLAAVTPLRGMAKLTWPKEQGGQSGPPQSTPVSLTLCLPSEHVVGGGELGGELGGGGVGGGGGRSVAQAPSRIS